MSGTGAGDISQARSFAQEAIRAAYEQISAVDEALTPHAFVIADGGSELLMLADAAMNDLLSYTAVLSVLVPDRVRRRHARAAAITMTITSPFHKCVHDMTVQQRDQAERGEIPDGWPADRRRWACPEEQMLALFTATAEEVWWARVIRIHNQGPRLGYWATLPPPPAQRRVQRRIFGEIRAALREQQPPAPARRSPPG